MPSLWTPLPPPPPPSHRALTHRYGESLPGDLASSLNDGGDLLNLSVENALADLAHFMKAAEGFLGGGSREWLMVGGSYPGALSAWFRLKHPELATVRNAHTTTITILP